MSIKSPLISVIIPTYNRAHLVAEAIDSVLMQNYPAIELIVVDDGSTDDSAAVIKRYGERLTYVYRPNGDVCKARNTGVAKSSGGFLAFLDSDDYWAAGKLSKQMAIFSAKPKTDAVFGHAIQFKDRVSDSAREKHVRNLNKPMPAELVSAMLIRRSVFERTVGFNEQNSLMADIEWVIRLKELDPVIAMLPDVVLHRRIHSGNMSIEQKARKEQMLMQTLRERIRRAKLAKIEG